MKKRAKLPLEFVKKIILVCLVVLPVVLLRANPLVVERPRPLYNIETYSWAEASRIGGLPLVQKSLLTNDTCLVVNATGGGIFFKRVKGEPSMRNLVTSMTKFERMIRRMDELDEENMDIPCFEVTDSVENVKRTKVTATKLEVFALAFNKIRKMDVYNDRVLQKVELVLSVKPDAEGKTADSLICIAFKKVGERFSQSVPPRISPDSDDDLF